MTKSPSVVEAEDRTETVIILGAGASIGSGYTRADEALPGDRGFFANSVVTSLLDSGSYIALRMVRDSFRRLYGDSLQSVGLEELWTFMEFSGKELFRDSIDLTEARNRWLADIRRPESRTEDEHCLCRKHRADRTIPQDDQIDLFLLAGWDLRRLLSRVYDEMAPPECNVYARFLENYNIPLNETTTFISLNYDTVLEHALDRQRLGWHYRHIATQDPRDSSSIRVLKPHGSLNWRFQGNTPKVEIDTDYRLTPLFMLLGARESVCRGDDYPADPAQAGDCGFRDTSSTNYQPLHIHLDRSGQFPVTSIASVCDRLFATAY